ncbi:MAG: hypothetical protein AB7I27_05795 [Bacteriovoracaceae bacterium]
MKWLILILLVSCGKQKKHEWLDLGDNDGDSKSNYLENGLDKSIANVESLPTIRGEISFYSGNEKVTGTFSNQLDLKKETLKMLSINYLSEHKYDYFSEWSYIKLDFNQKNLSLNGPDYEIKFTFEENQEKPFEIYYVKQKERIKLAKWKKTTHVHLTGGQINELLTNKAQIVLTKAGEQFSNVKDKTYRVFYYNGISASIYYLAKDYAFENFLKELKIENTLDVMEINLTPSTISKNDLKNWWIREFKNGDKVIAFTSEKEITENHKNYFKANRFDLDRVNGHNQSNINLVQEVGSWIQLKVRGNKVIQNFREDYPADSKFCRLIVKSAERPRRINLSPSEIQKNLTIEVHSEMKPLSEISGLILSEGNDSQGSYLQIEFKAWNDNFRIGLMDLNASTYVKTGTIMKNCNEVVTYLEGEQTNPEAKLSLTVEASVENF